VDTAAAAAWWPCELEIRQEAGERLLSGSFPYGALATVRDRGRVRKERFGGDAFGWQLEEFGRLQQELSDLIGSTFQQALEESRELRQMPSMIQAKQAELAARNIDLLAGHSFDKPLASMLAGTLTVRSDDQALRFEATLPPADQQPSWMVDTVRSVDAGLVRGLSPGFRVPPLGVVPNAEETVPEPGNPGVFIRQVNQALLAEMSLVTRPTYQETEVELRADQERNLERYYRWL